VVVQLVALSGGAAACGTARWIGILVPSGHDVYGCHRGTESRVARQYEPDCLRNRAHRSFSESENDVSGEQRQGFAELLNM
jgi:hypothetical protein